MSIGFEPLAARFPVRVLVEEPFHLINMGEKACFFLLKK